MAYFPAFIQMENVKVLLVGGGTIAKEKLEKLLDFTQDICIVSLEVNDEVLELAKKHTLTLEKRAYESTDLEGYDIIVVATNTVTLHQEIYAATRGSKTLVNSVDNTAYCDFIFPSYVQKGDLTVAFSTGGASPAFAKQIRHYFEENIPDSVESFLIKMKKLRQTMPKGKQRMEYFESLVDTYFLKYFK